MCFFFFFFKQKTAYEMRISDWSSDVCSSDLLESVEMRQAPWMFWITDLSIKDPFFILPIIMGLTMFIQQQLNPTPPDPMQAKVMKLLPIIFTFFFLWFPAGLVLYWVEIGRAHV